MSAPAADLVASVAGLIAAVATPGFEAALVDAAAAVAPGDAAMSLKFSKTAPPQVVIDRLQEAERPFLYGDYLAGVYLVSPFYRAALEIGQPAVRLMRQIAPPGFRHSEYYRKYYAHIGVADLIGVLLPGDDGAVRFLSLSRGEGRPLFRASERRALDALLPVLHAAARAHDRLSRSETPKSAPAGTARTIIARAARTPLTAREAEVVEALIAGHSEKSVARGLAISAETVKVHRRHAYRKLGVTTKGALFSLFVAGVRRA